MSADVQPYNESTPTPFFGPSRFAEITGADVFGLLAADGMHISDLHKWVIDTTDLYPSQGELQGLIRKARVHAAATGYVIPRPRTGTGHRYMAIPLTGMSPAGRTEVRRSAEARLRSAATHAEHTVEDVAAVLAVLPPAASGIKFILDALLLAVRRASEDLRRVESSGLLRLIK